MRATDAQIVFHLATYYAVDQRGVDLSEMVDVNVKAGLNVVLAAKAASDLRLLVNVGTCAEYGDLRDPATEESPLEPNSIYAVDQGGGRDRHAPDVGGRRRADDHAAPLQHVRAVTRRPDASCLTSSCRFSAASTFL